MPAAPIVYETQPQAPAPTIQAPTPARQNDTTSFFVSMFPKLDFTSNNRGLVQPVGAARQSKPSSKSDTSSYVIAAVAAVAVIGIVYVIARR